MVHSSERYHGYVTLARTTTVNFSFDVDVIPIKFIFLVLSIRYLTHTFTDDAAVQFLLGVFHYNP